MGFHSKQLRPKELADLVNLVAYAGDVTLEDEIALVRLSLRRIFGAIDPDRPEAAVAVRLRQDDLEAAAGQEGSEQGDGERDRQRPGADAVGGEGAAERRLGHADRLMADGGCLMAPVPHLLSAIPYLLPAGEWMRWGGGEAGWARRSAG